MKDQVPPPRPSSLAQLRARCYPLCNPPTRLKSWILPRDLLDDPRRFERRALPTEVRTEECTDYRNYTPQYTMTEIRSKCARCPPFLLGPSQPNILSCSFLFPLHPTERESIESCVVVAELIRRNGVDRIQENFNRGVTARRRDR